MSINKMLSRSARCSTSYQCFRHLIEQPSVAFQICSTYCTSPSNPSSPRFNPIKIQMISESLHKQIFKSTEHSEHGLQQGIINESIGELKAHGLWGKQGSVLPEVNFDLPKLFGKNVDDHFREIARRQIKQYVNLADSLTKNPLPPRPGEWLMRQGWTRYDAKGGVEKVNYPREDAVVFDVEVCMSEGSLPTLAVAVSPKAWYCWCSRNLTEDHLVISSTGTPKASLNDLISLENPARGLKPRLVVGHNVSYDRSYIKEQYNIKGTKMRFLDTLSLHMCVSGLTTFQRTIWKASKSTKGSNIKEVREHNEKVKKKATTSFATHHPWLDEGSPNSLADVYALYNDAGETLDKSKRDVFVTGTIQDVRADFQELASYCAQDVSATHEIFVKLLEEFCVRFPHPVTFAGMLEMGQAYLPVNQNWDRYIHESEESYLNLQQEMKLSLMHIANDACSLLNNESYKEDPWLWNLDWESTNMKLNKETTPKKRKTKTASAPEKAELAEETCGTTSAEKSSEHDVDDADSMGEGDEDEDDKEAARQRIQRILETSKRVPKYHQHMTGHPKWYRELCPRSTAADWAPGPAKITSQVRVTPQLLRLTWDGYPLYHNIKHGWGFLVPKSPDGQEDELEECKEERENKEHSDGEDGSGTTEKFPIKSLMKMLRHSKNSSDFVHPNQTRLKSLNSEDDSNGEGGQHSKLCESVQVDGCHFYKLPHKDGFRFNVGNPLAKDFLSKMEDGTLRASGGTQADRILEINKLISFWRNAKKRINSQIVVGLEKSNLPLTITDNEHYDEDNFYGAILPRVTTCGTVTRRAVEPTWLTASNAREDRVGSELKAMVQAPPGYHFVGADVDSQELWIAALLGDANFCGFHGCTAFGWMNLQGKKSNETDLHSKTASTVSISRDQAKIFNYGRIYGAGQTFAVRLLMQFNHRLSLDEAKDKAKTMYEATKGTRMFKLTEAGIEAMESVDMKPDRDYNHIGYNKLRALARRLNTNQELLSEELTDGMEWTGGSESAMFNKLESIAESCQPSTPVLKCRISRALEPESVNNEFLTSRINWVVQSSAVDYLHLMLVCMRWLFDEYDIDGRFCISIHDEVRYLVNSEDRYRAALALQITNILTRSVFAYNVGMHDLPQSVAFFSAVDVDTVLRKEASMDCKSPSNPYGLQKGYGIALGEELDVLEILKITQGSLEKETEQVDMEAKLPLTKKLKLKS